MSNSTPRRKSRKPPFPLWKHATGQWAKKIRGRFYYFGTDRDAALAEYLRAKPYLEKDQPPRQRKTTGPRCGNWPTTF
jgi:hypothetical protein